MPRQGPSDAHGEVHLAIDKVEYRGWSEARFVPMRLQLRLREIQSFKEAFGVGPELLNLYST
jgi:hypothetical protein